MEEEEEEELFVISLSLAAGPGPGRTGRGTQHGGWPRRHWHIRVLIQGSSWQVQAAWAEAWSLSLRLLQYPMNTNKLLLLLLLPVRTDEAAAAPGLTYRVCRVFIFKAPGYSPLGLVSFYRANLWPLEGVLSSRTH